jgi:alpha-galactosidase
MTNILETEFFQLIIDPDSSSWSVYSKIVDGALIENAGMGITYRIRRQRGKTTSALKFGDTSNQIYADHKHGSMNMLVVETEADSNGVICTITFALPEKFPVLYWKLDVENGGEKPIYLERLELLDAGPIPQPRRSIGLVRSKTGKSDPSRKSAVRLTPKLGELAFYSNGWGSWNFSAVYAHDERSRQSRLGPFTQPMRKNYGTPQLRGKGRFAGDMFGILGDRENRTGILLGFLSQNQHFGSIEASTHALSPALRLWSNGDDTRLDPAHSMHTDWACVQMLELDDHAPLDPYLDAVAREHQMPAWGEGGKAIPVGWCSWYQFFQEVTAQDVRDNLATIRGFYKDIPIDLIQIDDGFQAQVGDWLDFSPDFPDGVTPLAAEIHEAGLVPGIWLAPFIVHPGSRLAREKRDWLLRNAWGVPVTAGFIWNKFTRALDLTHPEALDYVTEVVSTAAHDWGYSYLKLDFLYAAALPGRYRDPTRTRAQVLRDAMVHIREVVGSDTTLLGCGCPIGSGLGIVDAMRIGADVAPNWSPRYGGISFLFKNEPDFPAGQNALQNVITRAFMHEKWWVNDPDCLLVRADSDLSLHEVQTMATVIALSGGALLFSDHLPQVSPERIRLAKSLIPLIGQRPSIIDWFDTQTPQRMRVDLVSAVGEWQLLAYVNWSDHEEDIQLRADEFRLDPNLPYIGRDYWSGENHVARDGILGNFVLPAHGSALMAVRSFDTSQPVYLGSDLHISQGNEVSNWQVFPTKVVFDLQRPGQSDGMLDLYLPKKPKEVLHAKQSVTYKEIGQDIYRLNLNFVQSTNVQISW